MTDDATAVGKMLYYARRAGYLEGALRLIADGRTGVRPRLAARRALEAVGEDWLVNGTPQTNTTPGTGGVPKLRSVRETAP
jgi:hypothetical protein